MLTPTRRSTLALLAAALLLPVTAASAQDWAKTRLEASTRHHEYVTLKHGDRTLQAFVVYPEVKKKATVIVLIHEIFGLSNWAKEMADELAGEGYIVIAPDMLSGPSGPNASGTPSYPDQDSVVKAVSGLDPAQVTADLDAAADYGKTLPASNGKTTVAGFCWGGGKSFAFATHRKDLSAAFVFYGPPPPDVSTVAAPVYGFYAGNDARIDATLPATVTEMKAAGKKFDPVTYDGAGHGFMRAGEDPGPAGTDANKKARAEALARMLSILKQVSTMPMAKVAAPANSGKVIAKKASASAPICHDMKDHQASM